jgi:hypothetical protein
MSNRKSLTLNPSKNVKKYINTGQLIGKPEKKMMLML